MLDKTPDLRQTAERPVIPAETSPPATAEATAVKAECLAVLPEMNEVVKPMGPLSMSRKQWYEEIWKLSASGTAKKHDSPYGPFMQQIKASGIPIPPPGYWTKINFEKPVKVIPLPGDPEEILTIYQAFPKRKSEKQPPLPERNPSPRAIDPQTGYQSKIR